MTCIEKHGTACNCHMQLLHPYVRKSRNKILMQIQKQNYYENPETKYLRKSRNKIITQIQEQNYYANPETKLLRKSRKKNYYANPKTKLLRQFPNKQARNYLQMRKPAFVTSNLATFTAHNGLSTPKHLPIVKVLSFFIISL